MADDKKLTTRADDFSAWYNELVLRAELADYSPVKGSMVIRPNGYGIWERMQRALDDMFKATGHQNAYFPLFIPQSFLQKEAQHVEGFAPETAVVTHGGGKALEEPLVVRPTSETIIYHMFAKWVQSYRDLPILMNQWANVVRWEMRTRLFLRTLEFLWQEGHTAHATHDEAEAETRRMLGVYREFMEGWIAMPVVTGQKTESEKFAGALRTYSCEAMMQDNKALQAGTSHNLGQNFAKAFDLKFQDESGEMAFAWNTSWGVSTRMVGGLIMTHSDDNGLICPPRLAPVEVVIIPIYKSDDEKARVVEAAYQVRDELAAWTGRGATDRLRVTVDAREGIKPGAKYYEHEMRGIPLRLEIGPKDLEKGSVFSARRDTRAKAALPMAGLPAAVAGLLETIQADLLAAATARREANSHRNVTSYAQFKEIMEGPGGFVYAGWNGDPAVEAKVKEETKATIRCIPDPEFRSAQAPTTCLVTGEPARHEVIWAKAY
ncbi:MAG: proline--tRNA ligase [Gemmatimonadota bacterium]|jgi:prolyl-tRNA synthetase|nr:proline--tRNA ligase [Gemmatimonadota bacterium]MDQ8147104.1 proline--tRNA ligase [Gemmatimonadota bacterium]MDQ8148682.1 proline--tRNA ligase [Gemmatimonadota bacterium]MDQ8176374.1 proline--tRNA ligase [Gemmatimonadota bacterium]